MKTTRRQNLLAAALIGALALVSTAARAADANPNLVFILADNVGLATSGPTAAARRAAHRHLALTNLPARVCA